MTDTTPADQPFMSPEIHLLKSIKEGKVEVVRGMLLRHPQLAQQKGAILAAARSSAERSDGLLQLLHEHGADFAAVRDSSGRGCMYHAHARHLRWLAERGCKPEHAPGTLAEAFSAAFFPPTPQEEQASMDRLRTLLELGANVDERNESWDTPLMICTAYNEDLSPEQVERHLSLATLLLDVGADPNLRRPDSRSILAAAIGPKNAACVELLLKRGARWDPGCGQETWIASNALSADAPGALAHMAAAGVDLRRLRFGPKKHSLVDQAVGLDKPAVLTWLLTKGGIRPGEVRKVPKHCYRCESVVQALMAREQAHLAVADITNPGP